MNKCFVMLVLFMAAAVSQAASYIEMYGYDTMVGNNSVAYDGEKIINPDSRAAASDGEYIYHILTNGSKPAITKVDPLTNTTETIVDTDSWIAASGSSQISALYNLSVQGGKLQFSDTSTTNVWSVDIMTKEISSMANYSQIVDQTPGVSDNRRVLLSPADGFQGSYYFYEKYSKSILVSDGDNVSLFLSNDKLVQVTGTDSVSGGITFGNDGNMIWGSNTTDSMYSWDKGTQVGQLLLSASEIMNVTGRTSGVGFGDIFYAPDGKVYFYETYSDSILSFDCLDTANTLQVVLSEQELQEGPLQGDNVFSLLWYNDNIAFSSNNQTGFYVVPEPITLSLLGLGGLALARRKKHI